MQNSLSLYLWRRGRGVHRWNFLYMKKPLFQNCSWFTTPGWYHRARKYTYRLTIDQDFPSKPLWLGKRVNGAWVNTEILYEPLVVTHDKVMLLNVVSEESWNRRSIHRETSSLDKQRELSSLQLGPG